MKKVEPLEKRAESDFKSLVTACGGKYLKFAIEGEAGYPDRVILLPGAVIFFIEWKRRGISRTKRRGEKLQDERKRELEALGFSVYKITSVKHATSILHNVTGVNLV